MERYPLSSRRSLEPPALVDLTQNLHGPYRRPPVKPPRKIAFSPSREVVRPSALWLATVALETIQNVYSASSCPERTDKGRGSSLTRGIVFRDSGRRYGRELAAVLAHTSAGFRSAPARFRSKGLEGARSKTNPAPSLGRRACAR
jgi:hypothetical protein